MSGRKLGGGRVLGSGKGLAPPAPAPPAVTVQRATSPPAPSDSTLSIGSPAASASASASVSASPSPGPGPLPGFPQDLSSAVSLSLANGTRDGPASSTGAAGSSKLVCPICEDEMMTLLQLNRHIDDNHQELPAVEQDEVKTWFDKQVLKAKRFQPLSLINQKLRGLDVFESNETLPPPAAVSPNLASRPYRPGHAASASYSGVPSARASPLPDMPFDPDDVITRSHWQRPGPNDPCTDPACDKRLGAVNGSINCRKCGRLFCEEHTMYQMKLSRSAAHEPVRGYWYRVCETCYKSRDGYNDHNGSVTDHTATFTEMRRQRVERQTLEVSRLEKRLTRLTQLLAGASGDVLASGNGSGGPNLLGPVASLSGQRNPRKAIEQSIVTWEDDASVSRCPFCQQDFGSWTFRRHHCRICGRVVCADSQTACSTEVGLNVANPTASATEKLTVAPSLNIDVRMCRDCKFTIFAKRDFTESILHKPPDQKAYETLRQFQRGIQMLLPNFQRALIPMQDERNPPSHAQIQEASKLRKRLTDSFTKYDTAAKRLRDLRTDSPTQKQLQKAIYMAGSSFLHMHMLPLKNLPRLLKPSGATSPTARGRYLTPHGQYTASPLRNGDAAETASQASETSTVVSALETEEKDLRERLVVLEEQRYMVKDMIASSQGARRFEEVSALTRNVEELDKEIDSITNQVSGVESKWKDLYANGNPNGIA